MTRPEHATSRGTRNVVSDRCVPLVTTRRRQYNAEALGDVARPGWQRVRDRCIDFNRGHGRQPCPPRPINMEPAVP